MASTKPHDHRIIHSSEEPNYRTPQALYRALDRAFEFKWDAAAGKANALAPPLCYFGPDHPHPEHQDALAIDWPTRWSPYFLNPPYSRKLLRETKNPAMAIENWAQKCWEASQAGATIVGLFPFAPQTGWYTTYVYGHRPSHNIMGEALPDQWWSGHAAMEEWRLPHRVTYDKPDGSGPMNGNAGVNSVVIVWRPNPGFVGPWQPAVRYWSYR